MWEKNWLGRWQDNQKTERNSQALTTLRRLSWSSSSIFIKHAPYVHPKPTRKSCWNLSQKSYPDKVHLCAVGPDLFESPKIILEKSNILDLFGVLWVAPRLFCKHLSAVVSALTEGPRGNAKRGWSYLFVLFSSSKWAVVLKVGYADLLLAYTSHYKTPLKGCLKTAVTVLHSHTALKT